MERMKKERYLLAVYLVVFLISIVLIIVGINLDPKEYEDLRGIILNISTELIAVVVIFFIINKIFLVDQWNADEKITELKEVLEKTKKTSAIDFFEKNINLTNFYENAIKIELSGVTLNSEVNKNFSLFRDKILEGHEIKFMLIDPKSTAPKTSSLRSEDEGNVQYYLRKLKVVFGDFDYLYKSIKNTLDEDILTKNFQVKLLPYPPSFAIHRITKNNGRKDIIVEIFPHKVGYDFPPMFVLNSKNDKEWYDFFSDQYDAMWDKATIWSFTDK